MTKVSKEQSNLPIKPQKQLVTTNPTKRKEKQTYNLSRFLEKVQRFQKIKGEVDFGWVSNTHKK